MKNLTAILGAISLCIASFFLGNYLAMSQARSIALTSTNVAATQMASSTLVRVMINAKILGSIRAGKPWEAIRWACKDLSGAGKTLKELSSLDVLNRESIRKGIEAGDEAYASSCTTEPR